MADEIRETRERYRFFLPIQTRWNDNDTYGHVNNAVYYEYFDTAVNRFLVDEGGLDIHTAPCIGLVVESMCRYHAAVSYPEALQAGLRVGHLGRSSVRYEVGIFRRGEDAAAADGHFIHVFVDRETNRPHPIPAEIRSALERLKV
ncbi:acyl-CoA thioester hydrolase [Constrictibacter sp. MBR-5]|jgi:acyl-CoA thioester hydrolase|uniref:acyl-CoA thioesterase n=1 Tax=Constrictibacter sp. MBR-5 TaxID=3156467 RepID=UPI0033942D81